MPYPEMGPGSVAAGIAAGRFTEDEVRNKERFLLTGALVTTPDGETFRHGDFHELPEVSSIAGPGGSMSLTKIHGPLAKVHGPLAKSDA